MCYQIQMSLIFEIFFSDIGHCFRPAQTKCLENQKFGYLSVFLVNIPNLYINWCRLYTRYRMTTDRIPKLPTIRHFFYFCLTRTYIWSIWVQDRFYGSHNNSGFFCIAKFTVSKNVMQKHVFIFMILLFFLFWVTFQVTLCSHYFSNCRKKGPRS